MQQEGIQYIGMRNEQAACYAAQVREFYGIEELAQAQTGKRTCIVCYLLRQLRTRQSGPFLASFYLNIYIFYILLSI